MWYVKRWMVNTRLITAENTQLYQVCGKGSAAFFTGFSFEVRNTNYVKGIRALWWRQLYCRRS